MLSVRVQVWGAGGAGGAACLSSLGTSADQAAGGAGANGAVIISYLLPRILPAEFLYFNIAYNSTDKLGHLSWATAKEQKNSRFEIQRSLNNVNSWNKIGEISGNQDSTNSLEYNFIDKSLPNSGGRVFYRIKQLNAGGYISYSSVRSIQVEPMASSSQWRVYPNPTTGDPFTVELADDSNYRDEAISLRVMSMTGQSKFMYVDDIRNIGNQVAEWFAGQANGVYILEITWGSHQEHHRVILNR